MISILKTVIRSIENENNVDTIMCLIDIIIAFYKDLINKEDFPKILKIAAKLDLSCHINEIPKFSATIALTKHYLSSNNLIEMIIDKQFELFCKHFVLIIY
jgi:hypothetical protein